MERLERGVEKEARIESVAPGVRGAAGAVRRESTLLGIGLLSLSSLFIAGTDTAAKFLIADYTPTQVLWMRFFVLLAVLAPVFLAGGGLRSLATQRPVLHLARGAMVVASSLLYVVALAFMQLAEITAIFFTAPVFVTVLSIFLLREKVSGLLWVAVAAGLCGLLLIVRPGTEAFKPAAVIVVIAALLWGGAVISTRKMSAERPITMMLWSALVGFAALTVLLPFVWKPVAVRHLPLILAMGVSSASAHWLIVLAYRHAGASTLAPFSYLLIVTATLFGYLFFNQIPDGWTLAGAAVIVAAGLVIAQREHARTRN